MYRFWFLFFLTILGSSTFALATAPRCFDLFPKESLQNSVLRLQQEGKFVESQALRRQVAELLSAAKIISLAPMKSKERFNTEVYMVTLDNGIVGVWKPDPEWWFRVSQKYAVNSSRDGELLADDIELLMESGLVPVTVDFTHNGFSGTLQAFVAIDLANTLTTSQLRTYWEKAFLTDYIFGVADRAVDPTTMEPSENFLLFRGQPVLYDNGLIMHPQSLMMMFSDTLLRENVDFYNPELKIFREKLETKLSKPTITTLLSRRNMDSSLSPYVLQRRQQVLRLLNGN